MKNLKMIFVGVSALCLTASIASAEQNITNDSSNARGAEFFDPHAAPHLDSENNSFIDALYALRDICGYTQEKWLVDVCNEGDEVIDNTAYIRLDVSNPPEVWEEHHNEAALVISASLQYIFNTSVLNQGGECRGDKNATYEIFTISHDRTETVFKFPCQPA